MMIAKSLGYAGKRLVGYLVAAIIVAGLFLGVASAFSKSQRCTYVHGHEICIPQLTAWR